MLGTIVALIFVNCGSVVLGRDSGSIVGVVIRNWGTGINWVSVSFVGTREYCCCCSSCSVTVKLSGRTAILKKY